MARNAKASNRTRQNLPSGAIVASQNVARAGTSSPHTTEMRCKVRATYRRRVRTLAEPGFTFPSFYPIVPHSIFALADCDVVDIDQTLFNPLLYPTYSPAVIKVVCDF